MIILLTNQTYVKIHNVGYINKNEAEILSLEDLQPIADIFDKTIEKAGICDYENQQYLVINFKETSILQKICGNTMVLGIYRIID